MKLSYTAPVGGPTEISEKGWKNLQKIKSARKLSIAAPVGAAEKSGMKAK